MYFVGDCPMNIDDLNKNCTRFALQYLEMKRDLLKAPTENTLTKTNEPSVKQDKDKVMIAKPSAADMPRIDIGKFSGELTDWPDFRKEYRALVHMNSKLKNPEKFIILKSLLPTDVFELIKNIFTYRENTGYEDAWQILEEKFSKRKNVEELLTTLFQQPSMNDGSSESINQLLDTTKKCLNGLMSWDVDTKNWDPFLIHMLVQKLSKDIRTEWDAIDRCSQAPKTLFDFFNFLSGKLRKKKTSHKLSVDRDADREVCVYCQQKHPLWKCEEFESLSIDCRLSFVRNKTICDRCLSKYHIISKCWKPFKCRICKSKEHHFLLHKNKQLSRSCENLLSE